MATLEVDFEFKRTLWGKLFYWLQKLNLQSMLKGRKLGHIYLDGKLINSIGVDKNLNVIEL